MIPNPAKEINAFGDTHLSFSIFVDQDATGALRSLNHCIHGVISWGLNAKYIKSSVPENRSINPAAIIPMVSDLSWVNIKYTKAGVTIIISHNAMNDGNV